jgi:hypothetical protein
MEWAGFYFQFMCEKILQQDNFFGVIRSKHKESFKKSLNQKYFVLTYQFSYDTDNKNKLKKKNFD